jgi:predicted nucleotidyltransferase
MGNIFNEDFQDFLLALNKAKVKYVLVGGYSVIYHGFPRTTGDLDIFVEVSETNYNCLEKAFKSFGMPVFDMNADNFLHNANLNVFTFGRSPVSIEILKEITGLTFKEVFDQAIETEMEGVSLKIINLKHLKENKKQSGRNKDLNDLENLP